MLKRDFHSIVVMSSRRLHWLKACSALALVLLIMMQTAAGAAAAEMTHPLAQDLELEIWPVLLPLLFAAASVERTIELGWNYIEWFLIRFLRWQPSTLKTASYVQFKSGTSLLAGFGIGILVANYSGMRLLEYLRPFAPTLLGTIPDTWDIILSGIIIAAGTKPAHDILGLITHLKNLTAGTAIRQREQAGAALAEGVLKLHQADAAYNLDIPGIGGSGLAARSRGENGDGSLEQENRMRRYANIIHDNLYLGS